MHFFHVGFHNLSLKSYQRGVKPTFDEWDVWDRWGGSAVYLCISIFRVFYKMQCQNRPQWISSILPLTELVIDFSVAFCSLVSKILAGFERSTNHYTVT